MGIEDVIDVSLLNGDAALDSVKLLNAHVIDFMNVNTVLRWKSYKDMQMM